MPQLRPSGLRLLYKDRTWLRRSMSGGRTWVNEPGEGGQQEGQVALKGRAQGFQASKRWPHKLIAAAALRLAKQRHEFGQQAGQVCPHVVSQGHCTANATLRSAWNGDICIW